MMNPQKYCETSGALGFFFAGLMVLAAATMAVVVVGYFVIWTIARIF